MKTRSRRDGYFERIAGDPEPIVYELKRRVRFSEVDVMGIVWFGRYPLYFEEAATEITRRCGLSFNDFFLAGLRAPIAQMHVDYFRPLYLDEEFTIRAVMVWHEGARLNTEFYIIKGDGTTATSGYMSQLFTDATTEGVCLVSPELLEQCRARWREGEFSELGI